MSETPLELDVETRAGEHGESLPQRFHIGRRAVDVEAIVDRWPGPDHRYFKLLGDDGGTYILRHDLEANRWELILFDARGLRE